MSHPETIRALERGIDVLRVLQEHPNLSLHELHLHTALAKSTLLRILLTLERCACVYRSRTHGTYRLGVGLRSLGARVGPHEELVERTLPILEALRRKVTWPTDVAVPDGDAMLILDGTRRQATFVINLGAVGKRPAIPWSAAGRAYLAFSPPEVRAAIIERLVASPSRDNRIARDAGWMAALVERTRAQGYGLREPGYWIQPTNYEGDDFSAMAVPVMHDGRVAAALILTWITSADAVESFTTEHLPLLQEAATTLESSLRLQPLHGASP